MRRRSNPVVIPDLSRRHVPHSAGNAPVAQPTSQFRYNKVPELWRKHARQPWRVVFPTLGWPLPDDDA
jgi:hypothetical protein